MTELKTVYRAMCEKELQETIETQKASFYKRFKWFSDDLEFIKHRVKDGSFNNSRFNKNAYCYVVAFDVDMTKSKRVSKKEIQFDRRDNPIIRMKEIIND